eukprot:TRINITY_DN55156_c0_g1_i1.p1 TRINITY_DN55156_c0_g1~~TRINITY_DN55156_c0_g1_i1.p1  ORF type:complete len:486 (-),score=61.68 TRINITY_DN55156_c0_g1_i1:94-1500(-)
MSGVAHLLKSVDQFRIVSRDITRNTLTGGVFTALAYAALCLLLIAELGAFFSVSYSTEVVMDENVEEQMNINFDILLFDLPCKHLKLSVWDKFGDEKMQSTDMFQYIPVDHTGRFKGMSYTKEEITILEQTDQQTDVDASEKKELDSDWASSDDHFKHNDFQKAVTFHDYTLVNFYADWCVHCRQFYPMWVEAAKRISDTMKFTDSQGTEVTVKMMKINCVDFQKSCQDAAIQAFPTVRLYKRDGTYEHYNQKRTIDNIIAFLTTNVRNSHLIVAKHHAMFNEGCQVRGTIAVNRVPGHFHLQAEAFGNVNLNPAITNVSHQVNYLSFGDKDAKKWAERNGVPKDLVKHIEPLNGKSFIVERFHEAPQHYLKVVSTKVEGRKDVFYQLTHTDTVRKLRKTMQQKAPQARFTYDFSPMSVVVKTKSKRWYEFLTSLFAILGGTYTVAELCSGTVDSVSNVVKEAMGKNN